MTSTTKKSPLDKSIEFTSTVSGIDKIFKVLVYCSKLVSLRDGKGLKSLDSLSSNLTDTRTALRLVGLLPIIQQLLLLQHQQQNRGGGGGGGGGGTSNNLIEQLQLLSMLVYYPCDNLYYLSSKQIVSSKNTLKYSLWSCRAWAFYILLDLIAIYKELNNSSSSRSSTTTTTTTTTTKARFQQLLQRLVINSCDLPMALHWSSEKYNLLTPYQLNLLGFVSAITSCYVKWQSIS
ncbi:hypothetical protein MP638_004601 [Amoeboaphelidium occidentale]|nr:hypothetical protein MP638_004601 [Amoeboaphelidium occidentale]